MTFDDLDIFYLSNNLSARQLRREIHSAEMRQAVSDAWFGTKYETPKDHFPWRNYAAVCHEAIKYVQHSQPKLQSTTGHIDIEVIKTKNDIVAVIEKYTQLRKSGRNFVGCCPIHSEKHPSLTVYPDEQQWWCYGCNQGGDIIEFMMAVENINFKRAVAILGAT